MKTERLAVPQLVVQVRTVRISAMISVLLNSSGDGEHQVWGYASVAEFTGLVD